MDGEALEPFRVEIPQEALDDLEARLALTRLPGAPDDGAWQYGANLDYMKRLIAHWRGGYDWRRGEAEINRFPQFRATVTDEEFGAFRLHFVHRASSRADARPLLISHGWPGSIVEFLEIIEPLAEPPAGEPAFHVVAPSLPGYGFSSPPPRPMGPRAMARLLRRLMVEVLGYDRFVAQGGDWGAIISSWLGLDHADVVSAIHLNMVAFQPWLGEGAAPLSAEERAWIERTRKRLQRENAYQRIQATKPQTLAFGLTDSPAGLAAWIAEKFQGWPGGPADADPPLAMDRLLDNIMVYWLTGTINTANWIYRAYPAEGRGPGPGERVHVPTACCFFPRDLFPPCPRSFVERAYDVRRFTVKERGGHFAAMENPDILIADIRAFLAGLPPGRHQA